MTTTQQEVRQMPKSYLSEAEIQEYIKIGREDLLYKEQSRRAGNAGDSKTSWEWLAYTTLSAGALNMLKRVAGLQYVLDKGLNVEPAIAEYGEEWLKNG